MTQSAERPDKPRRFYKTVTVAQEDGGFAVALDGRVAKTPAGGRLIVPSGALGELLAKEWRDQAEQIDFAAMPATRLAFTAIDRTPGARDAVAGEAPKLIGADLLCYFADGPAALIERQARLWGPWLAWAERELGLVLIRARGVTHQTQPPETLARAKALAAAADNFSLTGLAFAGGLYGSAVLAFAVQIGALSGLDAYELSRLDEAFQEERWGVDYEAEARTQARRADARMIGDWFDTFRP
jgi:chaperone required for assembly of F1-ATPase